MENKVKQQKALQKRASLPPERSLMYLPPFSLLYCWVHKAASTSWNKIFIQLAEKALNRTLIIPERNLHEAAAIFRPPGEGIDQLISKSLLFMVVRHPFERLVSAYRDKFELGSKFDFIYLSYAADILKIRYTGGTDVKKKAKLSKLPRPSFVQFIDYLLRTDMLPVWERRISNCLGQTEKMPIPTELLNTSNHLEGTGCRDSLRSI